MLAPFCQLQAARAGVLFALCTSGNGAALVEKKQRIRSAYSLLPFYSVIHRAKAKAAGDRDRKAGERYQYIVYPLPTAILVKEGVLHGLL